MFLLFTSHNPSSAQFGDTPHDEGITVDLGLAGDRDSQNESITAVLPVPAINGWLGIHGLRTVGNGEVLSEVARGHIQGGGNIGKLGLEGFIDAERNKAKGSDLSTEVGAFVRLGTHRRGNLRVSGGIGNYLENVDLREELGIEDEGTINRWLGFASFDYSQLSGLLKFTPRSDFSDTQGSLELNLQIELKENISLLLRSGTEAHSDPPPGIARVQNTYGAQARIQF